MTLRADQVTIEVDGRRLIDAIDLEVQLGELLVVVGPNGAGKSTLLAVLAGDRRPDRGAVYCDGRPLHAMSLSEQAERRAVVGAPPSLAFDYTVVDVVTMGWLHGERKAMESHAALESVLGMCDLAHLADRVYMTLSSGERQRVQFARGLMQLWRPAKDALPRWLLLDEPTANLDIAHAIQLLAALAAQARAGLGVLAIVHDLDLGARFADRVVVLSEGRVAAAGAPEAVMTGELLSAVYGTPIHVEYNWRVGRLVVLP